MTQLIGFFILSFFIVNQGKGNSKCINNCDTLSVIEVSQAILLAAKTDEPTDSLASLLATLPEGILLQLTTDADKKAFWINIYNAFTQIILKSDPEKYKSRKSFFAGKQILIAGHKLSLDDIEHGILRRSKIKWSLGYFNKWFPSAFEKQNRINHVDYRIHFSLNCGAKSCPPIAFYSPRNLEKQLEQATSVYLKGESEYDRSRNIIYLPALMSWFRRDFGGKKKMITLLQELKIVPANKQPSIRFKKYDWNLFLKNYQTI